MSTHANAAAAALREDVQRDYAAVRASAQRFGQQITGLREASDLDATMRATTTTILAVEALAHAATLVGESARRALKAAMVETGCPEVELESHRVVLAAKAARPVITDESAVPARFWVQPPPRLDLTELGKALRGGERIAGAEIGNAGEQILSIRGKQP